MTVTRDPAPAEPREGLPPCLSMAVFEGRVSTFYDEMGCDHKDAPDISTRYEVLVGRPTEWFPWEHGDHPETVVPSFDASDRRQYLTDDLDEAKAAFKRGREYVRTGEME